MAGELQLSGRTINRGIQHYVSGIGWKRVAVIKCKNTSVTSFAVTFGLEMSQNNFSPGCICGTVGRSSNNYVKNITKIDLFSCFSRVRIILDSNTLYIDFFYTKPSGQDTSIVIVPLSYNSILEYLPFTNVEGSETDGIEL